MDVQLLAVKVFRMLRARGLLATIREVITYMGPQDSSVDEFDAKYGTNTCGAQRLWKLSISSRNARYGVVYQPTGQVELAETIAHIGIDPKAFTFIDLGCGKGKALLVASGLGFKQAIGVEFAEELVSIAQENIRKLGVANATVILGDAAEYKFPSGDLVVYLFNPFSKEVMSAVITNLAVAKLRRLYVIYKVASCADQFDGCGFLSRLDPSSMRPSIKVWKGVGGSL